MNTHRYEQRQGLTFAEKEHKETQTCRNERKQEWANSEMNDAGKKQEWRVGTWWEQDLLVGIIMRNEMLQWQRAIKHTTVMSDM